MTEPAATHREGLSPALSLSDFGPTAPLWLPGHALNCYEGEPALRSWLLTPGLLTERIRSSAGGSYRMTLVCEQREAAGHLREIEMGAGAVVWMFARSRVPAATLAQHPWLAQIGSTPLGAALSARGHRLSRSDFEYARLMADAPIVQRALQRASQPAQPLWVRRSTFFVDDQPLALAEVFLPAIAIGAVHLP